MKGILCILFALLILGCVEKRDLKENTVVVSVGHYPDGLHPYNNNDGTGSFIQSYTSIGLVGLNPLTEQYQPILLKNLPQPDSTGLKYRLELNSKAKWDDGKPLTADDVVFSWKLTLCPLMDNASTRGIYGNVIKDVYKGNDNTNVVYVEVKKRHYINMEIVSGVTLSQQSYWDSTGVLNDVTFENILSDNFKSTPEIDKWFNDFNSADNGFTPSKIKGLGPYQVTEMANKSYVTLERKQNWWGEKFDSLLVDNYPEKIIFKVYSDPNAGYLALKSEEIDVLKNRGSSWISKFRRLRRLGYFNDNYESDYVTAPLYRYLGMNMRPDGVEFKPFFTDVRVRRAMAHLAPLDEMKDYLLYGKAERQASIVPPFINGADTTLKLIDFNLEKAKELLTAAGWVDTDGDNVRDKVVNGEKIQFRFKLNYYSDPSLKEIAIVLKESMKKAGVELVPNPLDFGTLLGNAYDHKFDAILAAWGSGVSYSDPRQIWHTESWANKSSNFVGFGDAESDSLIEASNTSLDEKAHLKAYQALQRKIYDEQPYIFFWSEQYVMACHKRFDNINFFRSRPNINVSGLKLINP